MYGEKFIDGKYYMGFLYKPTKQLIIKQPYLKAQIALHCFRCEALFRFLDVRSK